MTDTLTKEKFDSTFGVHIASWKYNNALTFEAAKQLIGSETLTALLEDYPSTRAIDRIMGVQLVFNNFKRIKQENSNSLKNKKFVLTGRMQRDRNVLVDAIQKRGGVVEDKITSWNNVDYLVARGNKSTAKYQAARRYAIPIITEEDLVNLLGGNV